MSSGNDDVRYIRYLRRMLWLILAAGAAAVGAMLLTIGEASAQPLAVPGIGVVQIPNEVQIPAALTEGLRLIPGNPSANSSDVPRVEPVVPDAAPAPGNPIPAGTYGPGFLAPPFDARNLPPLPEMLPLQQILAAPELLPLRQILAAPEMRWLTPAAPAAPAVHVAPRKTTGERAVEAARSKLGAAYRYGSAGPDAFDCSGLVQWSYGQAGVDVPRTSYGQLESGTPVPLDDLQPGDMVSFYNGEHSALYAGNGQVIHAATEGEGVRMSPISAMPVAGARRF